MVPELQGAQPLGGVALASGATVLIHGQSGDYGALTMQSATRRMLLPDELTFLQAIADVIAAAAYRFGLAQSAASKRAQRDPPTT